MKNFKLVAILAAAALLVVGASMTSFAATGWQEENGTWHYYDKDGDLVSGEWKKSGEDWFYLDDNGDMATEALVEYNDQFYYVDATGRMVKNAWKLVEDEEGETNWYYFQNSGKAYKKGDDFAFKTINGKKYGFTDEGKMVYGWVTEDGEMINDDEGDAFKTGVYYCGDENDGARRSSTWEFLAITSDLDDEFGWFWFNSNGKKQGYNPAKKINGKYYGFNEDGKMVTGWNPIATATPSSVSDYYWYKSIEDGAQARNGWFRVVPGEDVKADNEDYNTDTAHWYYADKQGNLKTSELAKINGKYYAFNADSEMVSGLYFIMFDGNSNEFNTLNKISKKAQMDALKDLSNIAGTDSRDGYYFFGDEETDGSEKTGTLTVTVDDDDYTMLFSTTGYKGKAFCGIKNKAFYANGVKVTAGGDDKYQAYKINSDGVVTEKVAATSLIKDVPLLDSKGNKIGKGAKDELALSGDYVLLTTSGTKVSSGTKKDGNDYKFVVGGGLIKGLYFEY